MLAGSGRAAINSRVESRNSGAPCWRDLRRNIVVGGRDPVGRRRRGRHAKNCERCQFVGMPHHLSEGERERERKWKWPSSESPTRRSIAICRGMQPTDLADFEGLFDDDGGAEGSRRRTRMKRENGLSDDISSNITRILEGLLKNYDRNSRPPGQSLIAKLSSEEAV